MSDTSKLTKLGQEVDYNYKDPNLNTLEIIDNIFKDRDYLVPIIMQDVEFSSLCPKTGQPDWAKINVFYIPDDYLVETKSLKLYYVSFRNYGEFHEDCVNRITNDIYNRIKPKFIRVIGDFNDRGGLAIKPIVRRINPFYASKQVDFDKLLNDYDSNL